jgi:hypothetical protein
VASAARTGADSQRLRTFREVIAEALSRGRDAKGIWQDLVDDHGFRARYASVKRFVLKLRGGTAVEARVVITTAPGEESQVDYGDGLMVRYPATGKYRRTRLFVSRWLHADTPEVRCGHRLSLARSVRPDTGGLHLRG